MSNKPTTQHEWTIHSINIHGVFFERWCQQVIEDKRGWELYRTNFPVACPPPMKDGLETRESALDVRAVWYGSFGSINLVIECKKNNPEYVDWIFFEKPRRGLTLFRAIETIPTRSQPPSQSRFFFAYPLRDLLVADEARETRSFYQSYSDQKKDKTKTSNAAITDAARQVALAAQAVVYQDYLSEKQRTKAPDLRQVYAFVPVILTTAHLFLCSFDPKDVNADTGEIPYDKAALKEVPYLIYEFPLPYHLQSTHLYANKADINALELEAHLRMHIFVVHSERFIEFLDYIGRNVEYFFMSS